MTANSKPFSFWRLILNANIYMLRWSIWYIDYQQAMLARMDWPRSQRLDDRKAELDRELLQHQMALRFL